ncbi:N-acetylmuramic acid 6-phosphate etherase [Miniphocaeibacter halophilus]|uniref:N-acetylmuramic acid 6-phosphate etherase n=1 Tax=Miniphocaeibacter halophilus TaxID=2931922 RepID=A0AC61MRC3_9FIRM|nr:N-acetylmuramic acid 6-phosphate etherase [Miniphocaeibacter halophilus]QQK08127.1 N-acetylmuramic acid 6-phosphate etherase [Miniphocaeibacter halophilus]
MNYKMDISKLDTEKRNKNSENLDSLNSLEIVSLMNKEDENVPKAIARVLPTIGKLVDAVVETFNNGGRLIYIGAGTSGRLGILDASECVPTFGVSNEMVVGLIAGGSKAIVDAVEGAEDNREMGITDLKDINFSKKDILVGLSASGRTPYVVSALEYAKGIGAVTGSVSCNSNSEMASIADYGIDISPGPEILSGSTRLKSGTAQKMVLNMISTASMIGIGKAYKNLMVDVQPTNEKLIERSKRIIMEATDSSYEKAEEFFEKADRNVKVAIVMILTNSSKDDAMKKLKEAKGFVSKTL